MSGIQGFMDKRSVEKIIPTEPSIFKTGQIVELNVGFKLVPSSGRKLKMLPTIRAIAMLSAEPVLVSSEIQLCRSDIEKANTNSVTWKLLKDRRWTGQKTHSRGASVMIPLKMRSRQRDKD